jgi:hypothetical protein
MKFKIEQLALNPKNTGDAFLLMQLLGMTEWTHDSASAKGTVFGAPTENVGQLSFNYDSKPLELEILSYSSGRNWLQAHNSDRESIASHIGMHCTAEELSEWHKRLTDFGVRVAQEVTTTNHTNPNVPKDRRYKYVIYDTRDIIGVDLKFIVRL